MSGGLIVFGIFSVFGSAGKPESSAFPGIILLVGLIWFFTVRFKIWWNHR
jgi:hypothetical protein